MLGGNDAGERDRALAALGDTRFDLAIVGGGITGAALAYLASTGPAPLRVALIEAGALASGTSSRSSKLLHGGLRYLAQGRPGLVRRLLRGRADIAALAPHLVTPAPFLLPLGPGTPHAAWTLRAALGLYGALERRGPRAPGVAAPRHLDRRAALAAEPLAGELATGGALSYGELAVDDAALVRELARRAAPAGALVLTHVACERFLRAAGRVAGLWARDRVTGEPFVVQARAVVDATGPWIGRLARRGGAAPTSALRLSRGTHVVLRTSRLPLAQTLVFFGPRDGRALFASPRGTYVLVGTTDVEHHTAPDDVGPTHAEIAYLVDALAAAVPAARLTVDDVVGAFAGVRALAAADGDVGSLDRDYHVAWDEPGLLALRGGKLTLALEGARRALRALAPALEREPRPAFVPIPETPARRAA